MQMAMVICPQKLTSFYLAVENINTVGDCAQQCRLNIECSWYNWLKISDYTNIKIPDGSPPLPKVTILYDIMFEYFFPPICVGKIIFISYLFPANKNKIQVFFFQKKIKFQKETITFFWKISFRRERSK